MQFSELEIQRLLCIISDLWLLFRIIIPVFDQYLDVISLSVSCFISPVQLFERLVRPCQMDVLYFLSYFFSSISPVQLNESLVFPCMINVFDVISLSLCLLHFSGAPNREACVSLLDQCLLISPSFFLLQYSGVTNLKSRLINVL